MRLDEDSNLTIAGIARNISDIVNPIAEDSVIVPTVQKYSSRRRLTEASNFKVLDDDEATGDVEAQFAVYGTRELRPPFILRDEGDWGGRGAADADVSNSGARAMTARSIDAIGHEHRSTSPHRIGSMLDGCPRSRC